MSKPVKIHECVICGKSFEARTRKYKHTCSLECGLKNCMKWVKRSHDMAVNERVTYKTQPR